VLRSIVIRNHVRRSHWFYPHPQSHESERESKRDLFDYGHVPSSYVLRLNASSSPIVTPRDPGFRGMTSNNLARTSGRLSAFVRCQTAAPRALVGVELHGSMPAGLRSFRLCPVAKFVDAHVSVFDRDTPRARSCQSWNYCKV
jgi:hypothetical protein